MCCVLLTFQRQLWFQQEIRIVCLLRPQAHRAAYTTNIAWHSTARTRIQSCSTCWCIFIINLNLDPSPTFSQWWIPQCLQTTVSQHAARTNILFTNGFHNCLPHNIFNDLTTSTLLLHTFVQFLPISLKTNNFTGCQPCSHTLFHLSLQITL